MYFETDFKGMTKQYMCKSNFTNQTTWKFQPLVLQKFTDHCVQYSTAVTNVCDKYVSKAHILFLFREITKWKHEYIRGPGGCLKC